MQPNLQASEELIAWLAVKFPLRNPTPTQTHAELLYEAGKRYVVEFLQAELEEAKQQSLTALNHYKE